MKKTFTITAKDLPHIHSNAVNNCRDLQKESSYHIDSHKLMAYSWALAVVYCLNSKGMLDLDIEIEIEKGLPDEKFNSNT